MSNIIYEDDQDEGYGGYGYDDKDEDYGYDEYEEAPKEYQQPNSLDEAPDQEDVEELADALELNRKLKEVSWGVDNA